MYYSIVILTILYYLRVADLMGITSPYPRENIIAEIAKQLNISRSTVQYRRTSSFEQLKKYLEENADEWIEW